MVGWIDGLVGRLVVWLVGLMVWLVGWLVCWLDGFVGRLVGWLVGFLLGCSVNWMDVWYFVPFPALFLACKALPPPGAHINICASTCSTE